MMENGKVYEKYKAMKEDGVEVSIEDLSRDELVNLYGFNIVAEIAALFGITKDAVSRVMKKNKVKAMTLMHEAEAEIIKSIEVCRQMGYDKDEIVFVIEKEIDLAKVPSDMKPTLKRFSEYFI
ncbi:hypothetical protein ACQ4XT_00275 [Halobacillus faecis]